MTYHGNENATHAGVRRYLKDNSTEPDATALSDARLTELMTDHASLIQQGIDQRSFAGYVGDRVAQAAGLHWAGQDDDEE